MAHSNKIVDERTQVRGAFNYIEALPAELKAVEPKWVIPVATNWSVHVYERRGFVDVLNAAGSIVKGEGMVYDVMLLHNKSGLPHRSIGFTGYCNKRRELCTFRSLVDLRIAIDAVAVELRPKTTVQTVSTDED